jgi:hypothetical protein
MDIQMMDYILKAMEDVMYVINSYIHRIYVVSAV